MRAFTVVVAWHVPPSSVDTVPVHWSGIPRSKSCTVATGTRAPVGAASLLLVWLVAGTVLAIGLLIPLAGLDNAVDGAMRSLFGVSTGLLLSGTAFAIVLAYTIRFLAASLGAVEAGLSKISRNIDAAARTLGATVSETLFRVHLPLLRPALGAAALLVFVDSDRRRKLQTQQFFCRTFVAGDFRDDHFTARGERLDYRCQFIE